VLEASHLFVSLSVERSGEPRKFTHLIDPVNPERFKKARGAFDDLIKPPWLNNFQGCYEFGPTKRRGRIARRTSEKVQPSSPNAESHEGM
jgi:hypothetical protein